MRRSPALAAIGAAPDVPPRRILMRVEYDGTGLYGWQRQPGLPTVQGHLEAALEGLFGRSLRVDGGSRTDAGVHARDQRAAFSLDHPIRLGGLMKALNQRLPEQISVRDLREVPADFQPRWQNGGKIYVYRLREGLGRRPLTDRWAWRLQRPLDREALAQAAALLVGRHDFTSFAAADGSHQSAVRHLYAVHAQPQAHGVWALRFAGDAFLKHMIRNLVGTLVQVGWGQRPAQELRAVLRGRDRRLAGPTAPAQGLELEATLPVGWQPVPRLDWAACAAQLGDGEIPIDAP